MGRMPLAGSSGRQVGRRAAVVVLAVAVAVGAGVAPPASGSPTPAGAGAGRAVPPPAVQPALDRVVADGVPGVIALGRDGGRVWRATSGVRNLGTGAPIRAGDRFRIGSNTKSVLAAVVLQLAGEGRLSLDDSVDRWLPAAVPGGAGITVRMLLNHTSGIFDYGDDPRIFAVYDATHRDHYWAPRDILALAVSHPALFPPGSTWSYSNTNYIVLGLIVEAVTGRELSGEVRRRIVAPLRLADTYFPLRDPQLRGRHTHGYYTNLPVPEWPDGVLDVTTLSPSWAWGAGAIVSTVDDLARFHRALITGRLLRPAQQRELMTTVPTGIGADYGLGVFRLDTPCGPAWGHDGDFVGYLSISLVSPDGARQAVVLLNSDQILSPQTFQDRAVAIFTAFCGQLPAAAGAAAAPLPVVDRASAALLPAPRTGR